MENGKTKDSGWQKAFHEFNLLLIFRECNFYFSL
jgi:hypothetical protein